MRGMSSRQGDATNRVPATPPVGLALAGGASEGAIYEIGAIRALDEAIEGLDLNHLGVYVGVSAGGFLVACLANGLDTAQMCRAIVKTEPGEHPFVPEIFFQPALREYGRRLASVPKLLGEAIGSYVTRREKRLLDALTVLGRTLPVALFDNEAVREYVSKIFSIKGRTDDFRRLDRRLVVVATDLESAESTRFGEPGWDHVPISRAVQASTALPGLYTPVEINGRYYVDGVLLKTMHASVAIEAGAKLVFCVNPVVPVDLRPAERVNRFPRGFLAHRGLAAVLSQTAKTLIRSRMEMGLRAYDSRYPDADIVLVEPRRDDYENFFSNIFSFASRRAVCARAYQATRQHLLERKDEIGPILEKHGLRLRVEALEGERDLWVSVGLPEVSSHESARADREVLGELEGVLERVERLASRRALEAGA
ncbi:MAG: patatin family protein [Thermoanaerobaculia bacterium]|nr:patatin family protein [Thermoanaerobaculia bacterium]